MSQQYFVRQNVVQAKCGSNDLDVQTLRVLEEALLDFPGVAVVVSHDRYFLDRVCDRILVFEQLGKLHLCAVSYQYYQQKPAQRKSAPAPVLAMKAPIAKEKEKARKLTWNEEREL